MEDYLKYFSALLLIKLCISMDGKLSCYQLTMHIVYLYQTEEQNGHHSY